MVFRIQLPCMATVEAIRVAVITAAIQRLELTMEVGVQRPPAEAIQRPVQVRLLLLPQRAQCQSRHRQAAVATAECVVFVVSERLNPAGRNSQTLTRGCDAIPSAAPPIPD